MNWHCRAGEAGGKRRSPSGGSEVTVGATGLRHGATAKNRAKAGSRLCRATLRTATRSFLTGPSAAVRPSRGRPCSPSLPSVTRE
jgi:hypothetical protein